MISSENVFAPILNNSHPKLPCSKQKVEWAMRRKSWFASMNETTGRLTARYLAPVLSISFYGLLALFFIGNIIKPFGDSIVDSPLIGIGALVLAAWAAVQQSRTNARDEAIGKSEDKLFKKTSENPLVTVGLAVCVLVALFGGMVFGWWWFVVWMGVPFFVFFRWVEKD